MASESNNKDLDRRDDCSGEMTMLPDGVIRGEHDRKPFSERPDGSIALEIDRAIFSVDAVLRTAYKFTDRAHLFLQTHDARPDRWLIVIRPKGDAEHLERLMGDFSNELIDQRLRERLEQQFGDVRTLIVAQAFAEGNLLDPTRDDSDYQNDPRGIGRLRP